MELKELKDKMVNCTDDEKEKIIDILNQGGNGLVRLYCILENAFDETDITEFNLLHIHASKQCKHFVSMEIDDILRIFDWNNFVFYMINEVYKYNFDEDYRKSIEKLFEMNVEQECCNLLDKLDEKKLTQEDVNILCENFCSGHALFNQNLFKYIPKYISKVDDLVKVLNNQYDDENDEEKIKRAMYLIHKERKKKSNRDVFNGDYWFYTDGVNWENWLCNQSEIIWMLKWKVTEDMSEEEQEKYVETLKEVMG